MIGLLQLRYNRFNSYLNVFILNFFKFQDVDELASKLPNLIGKFRVSDPKFNHLDFQWAIDADTLVYERVISLMDRY